MVFLFSEGIDNYINYSYITVLNKEHKQTPIKMENVLWEDQTFRIVEKKDRIRGTVSYLLQTASDVEYGQKRYWLNIEMGNDVQSLKENVEKWV